jgi:hypothetical protein
MGTPVTSVDFHFDIMCPWAYQASIWMRDVRDRLGLDVRWRFFSLEEINRGEGKKHPWERDWSYGWSMRRIGALLRRIDPDLLERWYLAAGTALHVDGNKPHRREVAEALIGQLGLDPALMPGVLREPPAHVDASGAGHVIRHRVEPGEADELAGLGNLERPEPVSQTGEPRLDPVGKSVAGRPVERFGENRIVSGSALRAANGSRSESSQRRISSLSVRMVSNLAGSVISVLPPPRNVAGRQVPVS